MQSRRPKATHQMLRCNLFGTFDVENYGDLLFPHIASWRLAPHGYEIVPVSPTSVRPRFPDALPPMSVTDCFRRPNASAGVLIGGGNIIHNLPTKLADYADEAGTADWAYASLWLGATLLAAAVDTTVSWNAPGVPSPLGPPSLKEHFRSAIRAADYCSVRDAASAVNLAISPDRVEIVPDSAIEISRVWPKDDLLPIFRNLLQRRTASPGARFIAIHAKKRSLSTRLDELAAAIDEFASGQRTTPILLAIGLCHGDDLVARELASLISSPTVLVDEPISLREIAAVLAHSDAFIGSSLHGYISAYSYGTPAVLVNKPSLSKFSGFLDLVGRRDDLASDWPQGFRRAAERLQGNHRASGLSSSLSDVMDQHWARTVSSLQDSARNRAHRSAFLQQAVLHGLKIRGAGWALAQMVDYQSSG